MIRSKVAMGFLWVILAVALHVSPGVVGPLHAQSSRKDDIVFNSRGVPLAGASIRICAMPASGQPCSPLALIYSDAALTQALANPTNTDGLGNYFFYAAPGKYEIEVSGPGITTKQIPNVILPSDPSAPTFTGAISAFSLTLSGNLTVNGNAIVVGNLASGTLNLANQGIAPGAAGAGTVNLYTKSADKRLYYKDDTGTEVGPIAASSGAQTNVVNTFTATQNFDADFHNKGPNPWVDVARFGGYFGAQTPPSTTGSITSGQATLALGTAQDFANGHGILVLGAGPASALSTPTGVVISPWGVTGTTAYNYCVVAEDYAGGRTACSAAGAGTTSAATLGVSTATLASCNRAAGIVTCTTTGNHNFTAGAQVNILKNSTGDQRFEGTFSIFSTPTATTFTFTQYGAPDVSGSVTSGSAQVNAINLVKWNSDATNTVLRSYVYRCTASCGAIGPNYALAGVAVGVDGYFQDYGYATNVASIGNGDVPATAPTSATNTWLSSTIVSGGGTTSLTLANNAGATVAGAKVLHDNTPNVMAACASLTRGGIVYIPNNNNSTNWFPINSTFKLSSCPGSTQLQIGNKVFANAPIVMSSYQNIQGLPSGGGFGVPAFYDLRPLASIAGFSYPFIYMSPTVGSSISLDDLLLVCNQVYQPCIYQDQNTAGGSLTGARYRHVHTLNGNGTSSTWVVKGGFGHFWEYGGWSNSASSFASPPGMLFTVNCGLGNASQQQAYIVTTQYTYGMGGTAFDACNQPSLLGLNDFSFRDMINETGYGPMFRFANTGGVGAFSGNIAYWEMVRPNYADSGGGIATPIIDATMVNIITGLHIVSPGSPQGPLLETNSGGVGGLDVSADFTGIVGAQAYAIPGSGIFANVPATTSGGLGHFAYRMAVPAAVQSAIVGAGGSVPIGAHTYAVTAVDFSGNETTLSSATTATTTTGNQTVTVTLPAAFPTGAKGVNVYRDSNRANNGACGVSPQFTVPGGTYVDTFSGLCGGGAPNANGAGSSLMDNNGLTTTQLRLSSESLTASPRAEQNVFLPGPLSSTWTASSWTLDKAVTVTRLQVQAKTTPAGCATNAVVRLADGTTPVNVTVTAAANDSGAITQNYAAGATLTIAVQTAASGCTTIPADGNVVVQYKMQ